MKKRYCITYESGPDFNEKNVDVVCTEAELDAFVHGMIRAGARNVTTGVKPDRVMAGPLILGTINCSEKGYRFIPAVASRGSSRKFWATRAACIPAWARRILKRKGGA